MNNRIVCSLDCKAVTEGNWRLLTGFGELGGLGLGAEGLEAVGREGMEPKSERGDEGELEVVEVMLLEDLGGSAAAAAASETRRRANVDELVIFLVSSFKRLHKK